MLLCAVLAMTSSDGYDAVRLTEHLSIRGGESGPVREPDSVTLLYLIKQVELAVRGAIDAALASGGLTATQYTALTVLEQHPGMTAAALARNSFVRAQTAAHLLEALERRGLIERLPDPESRRQMRVHITDAGLALLAELRGPIAEVEARMTQSMTPARRSAFKNSLMEARQALEGDRGRNAAARLTSGS